MSVNVLFSRLAVILLNGVVGLEWLEEPD